MSRADFYLICFVLGFAFSVLSFAFGGHPWHLPFHIHLGHPTAPKAGQGHPSHAGSFLNPLTIAAFLAWFGGTGYLLTRFSALWFVSGFGLSAFAGLLGASIIFWFLNKVLTEREAVLDPADFEMIGVLGRISVSVRQGGTGELIYSQAGTRRSCGVRAENGSAIPQGSEVVVMGFEKGIAYVRLWGDISGEDAAAGQKGIAR